MALDAGADALGLVGPMPSGPGVLSDHAIRELTHAFPRAPTVLLSSEQGVEPLCAHVARTRPAILQLVDEADPEAVAALRILFGAVKIWQVVHVEDETAIEAAKSAAIWADAVLLDSGAPGAAIKELGGTGRVHNWEISRAIVAALDKPVWLAGGLNPENVAEAVAQVRPYGVDVCSGLRPDGALDPDLLKAFIHAAKSV